MTLDDVFEMLSGIEGYGPERVAYRAFPEGEAPGLPFICYLDIGERPFVADGIVYYSALRIQIELYTQEKSPADEDLIETALAARRIPWEKDSGYLTDENCQMTTYQIEV